MSDSPFSRLARRIYMHPEKYAEYGRLLPKEEAMMRLRLEGMKMMENGEEPVFEDGSTLHEILMDFLRDDIIVVFERDGEIYVARTTMLADPVLDKIIVKLIKEKMREAEEHG